MKYFQIIFAALIVLSLVDRKADALPNNPFNPDSSDVISSVREPSPPAGLTATPGNTQVSVKWEPVSGATSYNIYRSSSPYINKYIGDKVTAVNSPYVDKDLTNGTRYYMVVTAVNATGESAGSEIVSAIPGSAQKVDPSMAEILQAPGDFSVPVNLDSARVFPNPWKGDRDRNLPVTFDRLTRNSTIKIFNSSGQLVATLPTSDLSATWNLQNDSGKSVASGLYVYLITNGSGQKNRGVLAVIK